MWKATNVPKKKIGQIKRLGKSRHKKNVGPTARRGALPDFSVFSCSSCVLCPVVPSALLIYADKPGFYSCLQSLLICTGAFCKIDFREKLLEFVK